MPLRPAAHMARWPVLRKKQAVVVPVIVVVVGALIQGFILIRTTLTNPVSTIVAIILSGLSTLIGGALLLYADRWEPEPPRWLAASFLWGGGVSLLLVLLGNEILAGLFGEPSGFVETAVFAPLTEESSKGLFLLALIASRRGRSEITTMTDAIIHGGFIGLGFSFVEDLLYIATSQNMILVAVIRLTIGAWGHSIYTIATAIGVWFFLSRRGPQRYLGLVSGWVLAVLMHGLHNASAGLGLLYFLVAILLTGGGIVGVVLLARHARHREQQVVQRHLSLMVQQNLITAEQAGWLRSLPARRRAFAAANHAGPNQRRRMRNYCDMVTELAFIRDRLDRMGPPYDQELVAQNSDLVRLIEAERAWVSGMLPATVPVWAPPAPVPVPGYALPAPAGLRVSAPRQPPIPGPYPSAPPGALGVFAVPGPAPTAPPWGGQATFPGQRPGPAQPGPAPQQAPAPAPHHLPTPQREPAPQPPYPGAGPDHPAARRPPYPWPGPNPNRR